MRFLKFIPRLYGKVEYYYSVQTEVPTVILTEIKKQNRKLLIPLLRKILLRELYTEDNHKTTYSMHRIFTFGEKKLSCRFFHRNTISILVETFLTGT